MNILSLISISNNGMKSMAKKENHENESGVSSIIGRKEKACNIMYLKDMVKKEKCQQQIISSICNNNIYEKKKQ